MRVSVGDLKQLIREEREYAQALQELFGSRPNFESVLDAIMTDLQSLNKKIEKAHELAPAGAAKAIVTGIHSDIFNKSAEIRKYVEQLKGLAQKSQQSMKKAA